MPTPLINFKAGRCDLDTTTHPYKAEPRPDLGYISLHYEDDLVRFCWRERDAPLSQADLELVMVPTDGTFVPYQPDEIAHPRSKPDARIFVLKFASSSQRHLFWLQSKPQDSSNPSLLSRRDREIGEIVNRILQGEDFRVSEAVDRLRAMNERRDDDEDETMEDAEGQGSGSRQRHGSGGAGAGATGGDIREEGEESREGGSDGARAAPNDARDASAAVQRFLSSISNTKLPGGLGQTQRGGDLPYPYLNHLLSTSITVPMVNEASEVFINTLLDHLPPSIIVMTADATDGDDSTAEPSPTAVEAAKASLSISEKRALVTTVLRSPQFHQALGTLTMALRDGGLPTVAGALGVNVENNGYIQQSGMPLGGGHAVKAFVDGITKSAKEQSK
ncbi:26S proteasome complex ubiquitin receptor, subunit Rpn13 [Cordyceps fumosorosea ARSEF 2679]|uniref:26S proteasome complex ubiquitin receptor, subunit Rpn13 n=1 Tax=Cordyceps fumosorosea (strain ARSEF 2679) TaxID=1081104 RepID=A0A168E973_CORFA|nr:26S proteasome complex ubiquitin receptor, subunit Rpn13 [Cordyceps fumosorosea ARSEF 2679]OAA73527.1 26S proteasome complex ubiquitin receptor, subunit Rpn13 [Cordyceps fumosorosea ARSEF 2679]